MKGFEFVNERLAYMTTDTDTLWFFKSKSGDVKAIAAPQGEHFTLTGHTADEVIDQISRFRFGRDNLEKLKISVRRVFGAWL